jgi:DNA-binding transcriptional MerR regulator
MNNEITIQNLTDAVNLTRYQIEAWISRGHFKPENPVESGKARVFTLRDAIALGAMAAFVRLGFKASDVGSQISPGLHGFKDDRALLVIYEGPIRLANVPNAAYVEPDMAAPFSKIIQASRLPELLTDPEITSFAVVDLNTIEERIQRALAAD